MSTPSNLLVRTSALLLLTVLVGRVQATDDTALVSRQSDASGGAAGNSDSTEAAVSDDGRYVAFTSSASNLGTPLGPAIAIPA